MRPLLFGEVLFDCFPDDSRVLGGAPFNVAWHLQAFGAGPLLVSRVGMDAEGRQVLAAMRDWGMDLAGMQQDSARPTGRVNVTFNAGEPQYDIVTRSAWDAIQAAELPQLEGHWLLYHGTLALRSQPTAQALARLRRQLPGAEVYCDVNLRAPWYHVAQILPVLRQACWLKLNADELRVLVPDATEGGEALARIRGLDTRGILLTHGSRGAELYAVPTAPPLQVVPAAHTTVVDTVGAGDAFCSVMLLGLLRGWPVQTTLTRAQDFASRVVGLRGATTTDRAFYDAATRDW